MKKTVIKTCSCFIDKAIWFVNLSQKRVVNPWRFDCVRSEKPLLDIIENKFIKEVRSRKNLVDETIWLKDTIVISCVDCSEFQLFLLSSEENCMLDTLNCRFVTSDFSTFGDDYSDDIFIGNSQFVHENYSIHVNRESFFLETVVLNYVSSRCISHVLSPFKKSVIDFFAQLAKEPIMNFLKANYMFFLAY